MVSSRKIPATLDKVYANQWMIPAPILVGIELNPGPSEAQKKREQIVLLKQTGKMTNQQISDQIGVDPKTVYNTWKRFKKKRSMATKKGQGRKRKLTNKQRKQLAKKAKKGKESPQLAKEYSPKVGGVSESTIQRELKREGLQYLVIENKDLLTENQIKRRLKFAKEHRNDDWKYALFSDEKSFQLGSIPHKKWQDPTERDTAETKRHAPKVHVWGGIGVHFKTDLYFFHQNLNADLMHQILKTSLPPRYSYNLPPHLRHKWILVQDNDPKHRSKKVTQLLDEIAPDRLSDFPANSPDFNIVEDVWTAIARAIEHRKIQTMAQLKKAVKEEWDKLEPQLVQNSVNSIQQRLRECIKLKGKRTSY
jgi:transposase